MGELSTVVFSHERARHRTPHNAMVDLTQLGQTRGVGNDPCVSMIVTVHLPAGTGPGHRSAQCWGAAVADG
jgi:hypothetical protein